MIRKFKKRPVVVEAIKYHGTPDSNREVIDFCRGSETPAFLEKNADGCTELWISTLEGNHRISVGDYVIKGVAGEFYPCKPNIFAETYVPEND